MPEPEKKDSPLLSQDARKLNNFYSFQMNESKLQQIKKNSNKQIARFVLTGIVFGFVTEWMLGNSQIYDNIIKKSTMRRLKAKKKEEIKLEEKFKRKMKKQENAP